MSWTTALVMLATLQAAAPPQEGPQLQAKGELVKIKLRTGGRLEGTVQVDTAGYLELRIGGGAIVGFDKSKIAAVERVGVVVDAVARRQPMELAARDQWFVVHDADGRAVGRLHSTVAADVEGRIRIGEEWEFRRDGHAIGITKLEVVTASLEPISCFYHERTRRRTDDRIVQDRLVRAAVRGRELKVETSTLLDRRRRTYPWRENTQFPMMVLEQLRQRTTAGNQSIRVSLFDPEREELTNRLFRTQPRRPVEWRKKVVDVREVHYQTKDRPNTEWIDASSQTIRRELNGPNLVAVPATAAMVEHYLRAVDPVFPAALAAESGKRFALWLPNPNWRLAEAAEPGAVTVVAPLYGASACLMLLESIDGDVLPESAADTVVRWLRQAKPDFCLGTRDAARVRGRAAVRLRGSYRDARAGPSTAFKCEVFVFSVRGRYMALCFDSPGAQYDRLEREFDRFVESVELYPEGVRPPRQGPLLDTKSSPAPARDLR